MPNYQNITSNQIAAWATTKPAQNYLPKLIRLLIHAGTKPSNCDFPAGDSTSSPGWDGELHCLEDTAWTPSGQSYWELSCESDPTGKANRDYLKRVKQMAEITRQQSTLVIVTARKWTQKKKWLKQKLELGEWGAIRVFDAGDLEQWLEQCPAVALHFAEELEITGWEVESISKYWQSWSGQVSPKITADAFHDSRESSQEHLLKQLKNNFDSNQANLLTIKADSNEEAIAFVCSVLHGHDDLAAVSLVVTDLAGWRFVDKHPSLKIAIAARPEIAKNPSKRNGLTVIIPCGYSFSSNQNQNADISIERPDIYQFEKTLVSLGFSEGEAHRIALNTGRSWSVYRRRFADNPAIRCPAWLNAPQASVLSTVCLLGSWSDSQAADKDFVSSLADRTYPEVEKDLRYLAQQDDAPVLKIGSVWKAKSALELLDLFAERITSDELDRFFELSLPIFATPAPELDLPDEQRYAAQIYGKVRPHSDLLLESLCNSLIKLAVVGPQLPNLRDTQIESRVSRMVYELFHGADGVRWLSLSSLLPSLAEAAPKSFLEALEWSLARPDMPVSRLITESSSAGFSGRCWHAGLLWALETLAWSPAQFPRVALILAKLAHVPYSSNWSNKPMGSLVGLFRSWLPQTAATIDQRIAVLDTLIVKEPEIAFSLMDSLVHVYPETAFPANRPKWRNDDAGFGRSVTEEDYQKMRVAAADRMLVLAERNPQRIVCLLEKLSVFDAEYTEKTLKLIEPYALQDATDENKELIRNTLRNSIHRNRNYSQKDEETLDKDLKAIEQLYQSLEPQNLLIRHRWLFANAWPRVHSGLERLSSEMQSEIIRKLRFEAIEEIHFALGLDGIEKFTASCGDSYWVGVIVAGLDLAEDELVKWIFDNGGDFVAEKPFTRAVNGLLNRFDGSKALTITVAVIEQGKTCGWSANNIARFLLLAPLSIEAWKIVEHYGSEVIKAYWSAFPSTFWGRDDNALYFVLERLLAVNRPRSALEMCRFDFHKYDAALIAEMLERILQGEESDGPLLDSYRIGEALEYLQTSPNIDKARLLRLEFALFPALGYGQEQQAKTLYESVMTEPALFTELICILYKPRNSERGHTPTEAEMANADTAWRVLRACKRLPGIQEDGGIDPSILVEFIDKVRELCRAADRLEVCDSTLGQILAYAPQGEDAVWPCESVRSLLDRNELIGIRDGFAMGTRNKRGVTTRAPGEGGSQERRLADYYRQQAQALSCTHINLAATLEDLARYYEQDGQREDVDARLQRERF